MATTRENNNKVVCVRVCIAVCIAHIVIDPVTLPQITVHESQRLA